MVIRQNWCIDCERCMDACVKTNHVPSYGYRTTILEQERAVGPDKKERLFMPVLCNHCNRPPCVRVCPTDMPLTKIFDMVEEDNNFQNALGLQEKEKSAKL